MNNNSHIRRRKQIFVPSIDVLEVFREGFDGLTVARLPLPVEVPRDVEICSVWYDAQRDGFVFIVCHPSFEEVQQGMRYYEIQSARVVVKLAVPVAVEPIAAVTALLNPEPVA